MCYEMAMLYEPSGVLVLVRPIGASFEQAFAAGRRRRLKAAVMERFGLVTVVLIGQARNGLRFDAPPALCDEVGLLMEDLGSRRPEWEPLPLPEAPARELATVG